MAVTNSKKVRSPYSPRSFTRSASGQRSSTSPAKVSRLTGSRPTRIRSVTLWRWGDV